MISGRQTLASIDQAMAAERTRLAELEQRIQAANTQGLQLQQADAEDYRALARTRIDLLTGDDLLRHIDQAEQQVMALLQAREQALQGLDERMAAAEDERARLESERMDQADEVERAAEVVDAAEASTQARLDADPDYRRQREQANEAERTALHAEEKAVQSAQEMEEKGASYRADPMFMYLWRRHYGTSAYKANPLARWLDGKVARLIGFADARANFARLNEIPERLGEHAEALKAAADAVIDALISLDTAAGEADGIPALQAELEKAQLALSAIDARIEAAEARQQELGSEKARFASGDDPHTKQALDVLAAELQRDDLMALRREALKTPFPDDDLIVERLLERDDQRRLLEVSLKSLGETLVQQRKRSSELEALRLDVKRSGYDRPGSTFKDGALITLMLGNFLNGMLDRHGLWRVLQEQQRYRPPRSDPSFGSGSFGRGSVWAGGMGDLGNLGGVLSGKPGRTSSRRRSGAGRPSGGGRGGGFRTGGGF
ncbi:coiled-coil domain-containing protein [Thiorhodovibrio frisius]|uniref:Uncharacterized protein n=1 Tax=Thiorhodovibrio frisius TaxID=631362 RepID=H8Z764_9GAMM|nr:hypothetical protein [Thiorhodovibrio frisius]EIC20863.1 hypothetical protein Thi970DRAFT_04532 [Thiorhodovibrio frisius]WPL21918.1 hypothetical protein Thiofri_02057 [Thiorhodovibrio frisius]